MRKALGTLIQGLEFLEYRLVSASYSASVNDMTPPPFVLKLRTVLSLSCTVLSQFMHGAGKVLHCVFQKTDNHYSSFIKQRFFYRERVCYNNFSTVIVPFYDLFSAICAVGQLPYMAGTAGLWYDIVSSRRRHGRVRFQRFDPRSVRAGFYGGFA